MITIAGGILLALFVLALLPALFRLLTAVLRSSVAGVGMLAVCAIAFLPLAAALAVAERFAPGYGAAAVLAAGMAGVLSFMAWETWQFIRWKRRANSQSSVAR